jgi:hypothetical protein
VRRLNTGQLPPSTWRVDEMSDGEHSRLTVPVLYATVIVAATALMIPRLASPGFGLLDDGVTILVGQDLLQSYPDDHAENLFTLESDRGRFRPLHWVYYALQYFAFGARPGPFFVTQWLCLTVTALLISGIAATLTGDHLAGALGGVAYVLSGPVIESYYTLSKPEPPLALWLAVSVFLLVTSVRALGSGNKRIMCLFAASLHPLAFAYFSPRRLP